MHQRGFPTNRKSGGPHVTLAFTEAPLMRLSVGSLRQAVKRDLPICCCNVKMSSPSCSVKRSSLNGDLHVEPEGTASAGAVEGAVWRAADECPGGRRPPDHCAAGPAAEAPVRGRGPGALVHGNRDRPSPRRLPAAVRDAVVRLMTTVYVGFNDTHLTEKLREHHALGISRETVRRYREQLGHPPKRARRAPRVRRRRAPS